MAINSTGRRVLVNKGIYDSTLQYYPMDAVYYEESYYICIKACVGIDPTDTNYWGYSHSLGDIAVSLGIRLSDGILYITDTVTTEDLGKVSILYRGEYSSTEMYAPLDVVTYEGSSYICIKDTTGNLPTDTTYFGLLCEGMEGRGITSVTLVENKHLVINYTDGTSTDIGEVIIKTPLDQIDAASINSDGHLILSKDDGTTLDAGYVVGPTGPTGPRGKKGDPFRYEDFTPEQLEGLRGPQGEKGTPGERGEQGIPGERGEQGIPGERGPAFTYNDFTYDQLEALRGPKGEPGQDAPKESVLFVPQTLTSEQQSQARSNIGASSKEETDTYKDRLTSVENDTAALKNFTPQPFEVSGDTVQVDVFQDAPLNVVTRIEPIQAGSGDPYPAGGGKNLLPYFTAETKNGITLSVANDGTITLNGTPGAETAFVVNLPSALSTGNHTMSIRSNAVNGYVHVWLENTDDWSTTGSVSNGALNNSESFESTKAYHRAKLVVYTNAGTLSNLQLKIQLEAGSTATEYAPYSNIRPINGWTGAKLTRCGKNLLDYNQWRQSTVANGTAVFENKGVTLTATGDDCFTQYDGDTVKIYIAEGETITLSWQESENKLGSIYIFPNGELSGIVGTSNVSAKKITYTAGAGVSYVTFRFGVSNKGETISYKNIMIEYGSTATAYEHYQGDTYSADFGQTVYGGTLDWQTGVLTVDRAFHTLDGSEAFINPDWTNPYAYVLWNLFPDVVNYGWDDTADAYCSHYTASSVGYIYANAIAGFGIYDAGNLIFSSPTHTTVDAFKSYLAAQYAAGTPVQICYKLATPTTIQLTPHQITALQGINNIWSNAGETTVSGRKDIIWLTHSLLERIAALEAAVAGL